MSKRPLGSENYIGRHDAVLFALKLGAEYLAVFDK